MAKSNGTDMFAALFENLSAKEMCLAGIQGIIAAEISMKRQSMGMNQNQFAKFMGVSQGLVSRWESGETNFTLSTLVDIADKLNIDIQCPFVTSTVTSSESITLSLDTTVKSNAKSEFTYCSFIPQAFFPATSIASYLNGGPTS